MRIAAIADCDPRSLAEAASLAPAASSFPNTESMLDGAHLDAVVIALPPNLHADAAVAALERGVNVYVEKPLASSLDDAARIRNAWRISGKTGMIGFNYRFNLLFRELQRRVAHGEAGRLIGVRSVFSSPHRALPEWKKSHRTGGGVLLEMASHHVDMIRFVTGREVESVSAATQSVHNDEDSATITLHLDGDAIAQSFFSLSSVDDDSIEVYGDAGKLSVQRMSSLGVEFTPPRALAGRRIAALSHRLTRMVGGAPHLLAKMRSPLNEPSYRLAFEHFVNSIRLGTPCSPDLDDGYSALAVITAAKEAAEIGSSVAIGGAVRRVDASFIDHLQSTALPR